MGFLEIVKSQGPAAMAAWACFAVVVTGTVVVVRSLRRQIRARWTIQSAQMVRALVLQFESLEWLRLRARCVALIKAYHEQAISEEVLDKLPVVHFFEHLGYMTRIGAIDREMVWTWFSSSLLGYHLALTTRIQPWGTPPLQVLGTRTPTSRRFPDFEWLCREILEVDRRRARRRRKVEDAAWRASVIRALFATEGSPRKPRTEMR